MVSERGTSHIPKCRSDNQGDRWRLDENQEVGPEYKLWETIDGTGEVDILKSLIRG